MKRVIIILFIFSGISSQSFLTDPSLHVRNNLSDVDREYSFQGSSFVQLTFQQLYELSELQIKSISFRSKKLTSTFKWIFFQYDIYREHLFEISKQFHFLGNTKLSFTFQHQTFEQILTSNDSFISLVQQNEVLPKLKLLFYFNQLSLNKFRANVYGFGFKLFGSTLIYRSEYSFSDYFFIQNIDLTELYIEFSYRLKQEKVGLSIDCLFQNYSLVSQMSFHHKLGISFALSLAFSGDFF